MTILAQSGRAVKRPAKVAMVNTNVKMMPGTAQIVRAWRRAKAPLPVVAARWDQEGWRLTEQGKAEAEDLKDVDLEPNTDPARFDDLTDDQADELRAMEAAALADGVAWVLREYRVSPDGDHLRFQGHAPGDFARVSIPAAGEETLVWRSSLAFMPEAAFAGAAALWPGDFAAAAGGAR